jgi:DNA-binding IclR family transcriptional regulator
VHLAGRFNESKDKLAERTIKTEKVPGTAAFSKFIAVLQIIAEAPGQLTMADLCERAALPRPTVYRIVAALRAEGLVLGAERFTLGPRLISLASQSWAKFDLRTAASEELTRLRDQTGETVHLAVPSATEMVYIDKLESRQTVRMTSRIGTRVSLHASAVGKAYLARLPADEQRELLKQIDYVSFTPHTIVRPKDLAADLKTTRERGYAIDSAETEIEIHCLGAAICDRAGRPIGCISVSVPKYRFDRAAKLKYPKLVRECADSVSAKLSVSEAPFTE